MAALLAGQGVSEVASQYNIPERTIREWQSLAPAEFAEVRRQKGKEIEDLLFGYLTQTIDTLTIQAKVVSEREYIIKQPAGELAVLHGVMADKSIRLLEAAERARQPVAPEVSG